MRTHYLTHDDVGTGFLALVAKALTPAPNAKPKAVGPAGREAPRPEPHRGILDRIDAWFWQQDQRAREAYLGKATNVYDLEARIRDLERGAACRNFY